MISIENLCVDVGKFSLQSVSLEVASGEYAVLMGKTGSGKTTLLEAVCGLKRVRSGSIRLMDREVTHLKPSQRGVGYVPQDGALFSTMTVWEHLAFALVIRKAHRDEITRRVEELAELLGIGYLLDRYPAGLSGGESQRVAMGRALAHHPGVLCLDEPLSALDEETRVQMYELLRTVQQKTGVTALHVTHSMREAQTLGDRLFICEAGKLREAGNPRNAESAGETDVGTNGKGDSSSNPRTPAASAPNANP